MSTQYFVVKTFLTDPPTEQLELRCPFCKEWILVEVNCNLYAATSCEECGADLTITGQIVIEGKAQHG